MANEPTRKELERLLEKHRRGQSRAEAELRKLRRTQKVLYADLVGEIAARLFSPSLGEKIRTELMSQTHVDAVSQGDGTERLHNYLMATLEQFHPKRILPPPADRVADKTAKALGARQLPPK